MAGPFVSQSFYSRDGSRIIVAEAQILQKIRVSEQVIILFARLSKAKTRVNNDLPTCQPRLLCLRDFTC